MRRRMGRPGLVGLAARTAVVAGTATAVNSGMNNKSNAKADQQQQAAAYRSQQEAEQQQTAVNAAVASALAAQQAQQASAAQVAAAPAAAAGGGDVISQLEKLAALQAAGVLTPAEFAEAKAKVLAS
jgi:hypothetical protein